VSRAVIAATALVAACAAPSGSAPAYPAVLNAGFEDPPTAERPCAPRWECTAHVYTGAFRYAVTQGGASGEASLCIERIGTEPWALVTQGFHTTALRNKRLRLSMQVSARGLEGGAGPWVQSQGGRAHAQKLVKSTNGWERVAVDLDVPAESNLIVVGATLEGGGRACFDDVRLEVL
jgi:hypothetical protein